ncbi:MAG: c-type cytochrome [Acidobacteria bacterium]|nr:c-type cytochrome [Acidobacteriota bacterium]
MPWLNRTGLVIVVFAITNMRKETEHLAHSKQGLRAGDDKTPRSSWLAISLVLFMVPVCMDAQDAAKFFEENCTACHTIGEGPLSGPDLKGVTQRKDRDWLIRFLRNPEAVINSGDPYAQKILQAAGGIVMPDFPEMTPALASALLDFLEAESKRSAPEPIPPQTPIPAPESSSPEPPAAVVEISDRPFTPQDVEQGKELFGGTRPLANGGPACFSCHGMRSFGGLGGGRLAPDLTRVYERKRGRKSLAAWLSAPPTTEMRSLFDSRPLEQEEIVFLVAYFEDAAKRGGEAESAVILGFFFLGLGGAIVALISLDAIWKRRLGAARESLLRAASLEGKS